MTNYVDTTNIISNTIYTDNPTIPTYSEINGVAISPFYVETTTFPTFTNNNSANTWTIVSSYAENTSIRKLLKGQALFCQLFKGSKNQLKAGDFILKKDGALFLTKKPNIEPFLVFIPKKEIKTNKTGEMFLEEWLENENNPQLDWNMCDVVYANSAMFLGEWYASENSVMVGLRVLCDNGRTGFICCTNTGALWAQ